MMSLTVIGLLVYLVKSSLIAGLLYGYYRIFLRNRVFHFYNRCYLLGMVVAALVLPLIHLPWGISSWAINPAPTLSGALHTITAGDWKEADAGGPGIATVATGWQGWVAILYFLAAGLLLSIFLRQLFYIGRLFKKYPREKMGDLDLYMTKEPGSPFSFLKNIFWNDQLDIDCSRGQQIFRHELYHVRQGHTLDLLLMRSFMIFFWPNPFLYLIYRELKTIHEFQADRYALSGGDRYEYAELLVWQTIDSPHSSLLHPFFHSSIKRRIIMITQLKSTRPALTGRLMVLPLLFLLLCAFAGGLRTKHDPAPGGARKSITVVIDPGHGGIDPGAIASTGIAEKSINLALALRVKKLSAEYNIRVLLTRNNDRLAGGKGSIQESLHYRTEMANENKADLFVSLHTDADAGTNANGGTDGKGRENMHGFHIYVSPGTVHYSQSVRLGSALIDQLKLNYATGQDLIESNEHLWVLRESAMPAVLILCGNISDQKDLAYVGNAANQETIARGILQGIVRYENSTQK
jgi:N-acetylmuramoyl-L-alanine amidase